MKDKKNKQLPGQIEMTFPKPWQYKVVGYYENGKMIVSATVDYERAEQFKSSMERITGNRATFEIVKVEECT